MSKTEDFIGSANALNGLMGTDGTGGGYSVEQIQKIADLYGMEMPGAEQLAALTAKPDTSTGKLEFDAWKGQFGIDTDKNFQDSVSRLDYEVKTWAANYGANAERLARMGLSNSGVVDIYGTGVIQAYLQSMNDLYLAKAEGDRQNAEAYKTYSDQYEADLAAKTQTKNNNILAAYNYGLGLYNGSNLNEVTTMIRNAGYDEDVITEAVTRLGAVDASMLPALQTQLAQDQTDINSAFKQMMEAGFDGSYESIMKFKNFYQSQGWSNAKIKKLIEGAKALYAIEPKSDKVKEMYAQIISDDTKYNSSMDGQLSQMLSVAEDWTEEEINELLGYLHDYEAAGQNGAGDQNLIAGVDAVNQMLANGNTTYDGSEAQKAQIKQALRGTEYETIADQILAQLDADLGEIKGAAATDALTKAQESATNIQNVPIETVTVDSLKSSLQDVQMQYGVDSEEYKVISEAISNKAYDLIQWALEAYPDGTAKRIANAEVASALGIKIPEDMTSDDDLAAHMEKEIMDKAAELRGNGTLSEAAFNNIVDDWAASEIDLAVTNEKKYARATGLNEAGAVVEDLLDYKKRGYITDEYYSKKIDEVIDKLDLSIKNWRVSWIPEEGADATIAPATDVNPDRLSEELEATLNALPYVANRTKAERLVTHNGKLYVYKLFNSGSPTARYQWAEVKSVNMTGDGVGSNKEMAQGIYEILVGLLSKQSAK